ncbi:hypothetical protein NQ011_13475, partial [Corynebacterium phoceense]|uniref:hypothetical protein n=1 Tax=Corynebacterium phoceense TaxID=1686286 RepID=UPI00211B88D0
PNTKAKRTNRLASYVAKRKETIWHIQKLHKINNTDPTPDGAKTGPATITNKCDNRLHMHR